MVKAFRGTPYTPAMPHRDGVDGSRSLGYQQVFAAVVFISLAALWWDAHPGAASALLAGAAIWAIRALEQLRWRGRRPISARIVFGLAVAWIALVVVVEFTRSGGLLAWLASESLQGGLAMTTQHIETLVIGAGQAGPVTGYHLQRFDRPFLIVEDNERIGDKPLPSASRTGPAHLTTT